MKFTIIFSLARQDYKNSTMIFAYGVISGYSNEFQSQPQMLMQQLLRWELGSLQPTQIFIIIGNSNTQSAG